MKQAKSEVKAVELSVGDKVKTSKGSRFTGPTGKMKVVEVGLNWKWFPAVKCRKPGGDIRLFLVKNLKKVN